MRPGTPLYLSFKKFIYFRRPSALVRRMVFTAGWNKARPIGKRTGFSKWAGLGVGARCLIREPEGEKRRTTARKDRSTKQRAS